MKPPHELDPAFEDIATVDVRFQTAVDKAKKAFSEQDEFNQQNEGVVGPSPAQAARDAFLKSLLS